MKRIKKILLLPVALLIFLCLISSYLFLDSNKLNDGLSLQDISGSRAVLNPVTVQGCIADNNQQTTFEINQNAVNKEYSRIYTKDYEADYLREKKVKEQIFSNSQIMQKIRNEISNDYYQLLMDNPIRILESDLQNQSEIAIHGIFSNEFLTFFVIKNGEFTVRPYNIAKKAFGEDISIGPIEIPNDINGDYYFAQFEGQSKITIELVNADQSASRFYTLDLEKNCIILSSNQIAIPQEGKISRFETNLRFDGDKLFIVRNYRFIPNEFTDTSLSIPGADVCVIDNNSLLYQGKLLSNIIEDYFTYDDYTQNAMFQSHDISLYNFRSYYSMKIDLN